MSIFLWHNFETIKGTTMSMHMDAERQRASDLGAQKQREAEQLYRRFESFPASKAFPSYTESWGSNSPTQSLDVVISSSSSPRR